MVVFTLSCTIYMTVRLVRLWRTSVVVASRGLQLNTPRSFLIRWDAIEELYLDELSDVLALKLHEEARSIVSSRTQSRLRQPLPGFDGYAVVVRCSSFGIQASDLRRVALEFLPREAVPEPNPTPGDREPVADAEVESGGGRPPSGSQPWALTTRAWIRDLIVFGGATLFMFGGLLLAGVFVVVLKQEQLVIPVSLFVAVVVWISSLRLLAAKWGARCQNCQRVLSSATCGPIEMTRLATTGRCPFCHGFNPSNATVNKDDGSEAGTKNDGSEVERGNDE